MKRLRNRIIVNGLLAAVPLALVGFALSQMAGMWVNAQSVPRQGPTLEPIVTTGGGDAVTEALVWKLPLALAAGGFLFVMFGEMLLHAWRRK